MVMLEPITNYYRTRVVVMMVIITKPLACFGPSMNHYPREVRNITAATITLGFIITVTVVSKELATKNENEFV